MKKSIFIFLAVFSLACNQSAKNETPLEKESIKKSENIDTISRETENQIIKTITEQYNLINKNTGSYKTTEKNLDCEECPEGAGMDIWLDKNDLKKIIARYFGETGKKEEEYYFKTDSLFFVSVKNFRYQSRMNPENAIIYESHFYFHNNKLISMIDPKQDKVNPQDSLFISKETELLKNARDLQQKTK
jgi:Zn-finger nucleic acid-binding protein